MKAEVLIADDDDDEGNKCEFPEARTKEFEIQLAASKDERPRRLAVEFLEAGVNSNKGWTKEQRSRLFRYRNDESTMVAEAAWDVEVPEQEEEYTED